MNYWHKNLSLLEQKNLSLAKYIAGKKDSGHIAVVKSESGFPTLKGINCGKEEGFLLSPKNPVLEAQHLLNGIPFNEEDGTLLFGFELGYLAREISRKKDPNHVLYIVEGDAELFKLSMIHSDLSDVLSDNNIYFFVGESIYTILDHFAPMQTKSITGHVNKLAMPSLRKLCEKDYDAIDKHIDDHVTFLNTSFDSFNVSKELRLVNLFQNIPAMSTSYPADCLKDAMKNNPAIIVAAGPSLKQDIESLGNRPKDSIIFCVDASLKALLIKDIKPDWIVTCDPYPSNFNKVKGLSKEVLHTLPLIYQGEALPRIIDCFSGAKFIVDGHNSLTNWVTNIGRKVDAIPFFPSVSHFAFLMARYMGADPIIFVGLDLSFPIDQEHADGCEQTWKLDFNNSEFIWVPNNTGGKVKTIPNFLSMIHSIEFEINKTEARCINASRDGAMIKGAEWMPLDEAFELFKRNKINGKNEKINFDAVELKNDFLSAGLLGSFENIIEKVPFVDSNELTDKYSDALSWMISEIETLHHICRYAKAILDRSKQRHKKPIDNRDIMEGLKKAYASAFEHKDLLNVLTDYLSGYMMSGSRYQNERYVAENVSSIRIEQEKITIFFDELLDVLPRLEEQCRNILECIKEEKT